MGMMPRLVGALALAFALSAQGLAPDWPHPHQNPNLTRTLIGDATMAAPALLWKKRLGGKNPSILVQDVNGDGAVEIVMLVGGRALCRDPNTGTLLWATSGATLGFFMTDDSGRAQDMDGDGIIDIIVSKASVGDTRIYALNGKTGAVQWTFGKGLGPNSGVNGYNRHWLGNIDKDPGPELIVFVPTNATGPTLYAFDFKLGFDDAALQWKATDFKYLGHTAFSVFDALGSGSLQVVVNSKSLLYVYDAVDGSLLAATDKWYGPDLPIPYGKRVVPIEINADQSSAFFFSHTGVTNYLGVWTLNKDGSPNQLWKHETTNKIIVAPPADMNADGQPEILSSEYTDTNGGQWVTTLRNAQTGVKLSSLPGWIVTGHWGDLTGKGRQAATVYQSKTAVPPTFSTVRALVMNADGNLDFLVSEGLSNAAVAAVVDRADDGVAELLVYRDTSGNGTADEFQAVDGSTDTPKVLSKYPFPKGNTVVFKTVADHVGGKGTGQTVVYSTDGYIDVLSLGLQPVSARLPSGGFTPSVLVGALTPTAKAAVLVNDSTGHTLNIDPLSGTITEPPNHKIFFSGQTANNVLMMIDVDNNGGERELLVYKFLDGQHSYSLVESDGVTVRWSYEPTDAGYGLEADIAGAGGDLDGDGVLDFYLMTVLSGLRKGVPLSGATGQPFPWAWTPDRGSGGVGTAYSPALLTDVDNDGLADVLISRMLDKLNGIDGGELTPIHLFRGLDGTTLATSNVSNNPNRLVHAELDGNGKTVDFLLTHWTGQGAISINTDEPSVINTLWSKLSEGPLTRGYPMAVDLDGDGQADLLHHDHSVGRIRALRGYDGAPIWPERHLAQGQVWVVGEEGYTNPQTGDSVVDLATESVGERALVVTNLTGQGHPSAVFGGTDGRLYSLDASTGELDWSIDFGFSIDQVYAADLNEDGAVELLVTVADGYLYALGPAADVGAVSNVRDGLADDVDVADGLVDGITPWTFSANWDPASGGSETVLGYFVRLLTKTGALVVDWQDVGAKTTVTVEGFFTLNAGVDYEVWVMPYGKSGAGSVFRSDGFRLADLDSDGVLDGDESNLGTDPASADTDGDGISDGIETDNGQPIDTDNDGTFDALDLDSDNDGLTDAEEGLADTDGDGIPDYRDNDDDGDGIPTELEVSDAEVYGPDPDGDGQPSWYDLDSDNDGVADVSEGRTDKNKNGVPDYVDFEQLVTPEPDVPVEPETEVGSNTVTITTAQETATSRGCSAGTRGQSQAITLLLSVILMLAIRIRRTDVV